MRKQCNPDNMVMGSGGIERWSDAVQMIMCGADFIQICTGVMIKGPKILPKIVKGIRRFMEEKGYNHYRDFRGVIVPWITPTDRLTLYRGNAQVDEEKCTGCAICADIGHCYAITMEDEKAKIFIDDCTGCSTCTDVCPVGAVSMQKLAKID
jgi:ferredoxin